MPLFSKYCLRYSSLLAKKIDTTSNPFVYPNLFIQHVKPNLRDRVFQSSTT